MNGDSAMAQRSSANPHVVLLIVLCFGYALLRFVPVSSLSAKMFRLSVIALPYAYLIKLTDQVANPFSGGTLMTCALIDMCGINLAHIFLSLVGGSRSWLR